MRGEGAVMTRPYRHTRKCRICEFPALDTGVPVVQFHREKLAKWWLLKFNTELNNEGLEDVDICQFCIWDARCIIGMFVVFATF
jgi:hypothetical protein